MFDLSFSFKDFCLNNGDSPSGYLCDEIDYDVEKKITEFYDEIVENDPEPSSDKCSYDQFCEWEDRVNNLLSQHVCNYLDSSEFEVLIENYFHPYWYLWKETNITENEMNQLKEILDKDKLTSNILDKIVSTYENKFDCDGKKLLQWCKETFK